MTLQCIAVISARHSQQTPMACHLDLNTFVSCIFILSHGMIYRITLYWCAAVLIWTSVIVWAAKYSISRSWSSYWAFIVWNNKIDSITSRVPAAEQNSPSASNIKAILSGYDTVRDVYKVYWIILLIFLYSTNTYIVAHVKMCNYELHQPLINTMSILATTQKTIYYYI